MSLESILMFLVFSSLSVPALPGATKIDFTCFDCESFQVNACSLPPLPTIRTLYSLFILAQCLKCLIPVKTIEILLASASAITSLSLIDPPG